MSSWNSLYWKSDLNPAAPSPNNLAVALRRAIDELSYHVYDPFGLMPAPLYDQTVKIFCSPPRDGWVRVCSEAPLPVNLIAAASADGICLALSLADDDTLTAAVYAGAAPGDPAEVLRPYAADAPRLLRLLDATHSPDDLAPEQETAGGTVGMVPMDALPKHMQDKAAGLNEKAMEKMFRKIAGGAFGKGGDADAAADLLRSANTDPNTESARRLRGILEAFGAPLAGWTTPTFTAVRDAYALHRRRERKPNARLYPGDAEAMRAVPDALDYTPLFAGRDADVD